MSEPKLKELEAKVEEAWKIAVAEGYKGTLDEYGLLCAKIGNECLGTDEKLDMDELDSVAGGGIEVVGEFIKDHAWEFGIAATAIASTVATVVLIRKDRKEFEKMATADKPIYLLPSMQGY